MECYSTFTGAKPKRRQAMAGYASSSPYVEGLPVGDRSEYQYNAPKSGLNVWRLPRVLNPVDQSYTSDGNAIVRFRLPNDVPIDFRKGFIKYDIEINTGVGPGAGTYKRLSTLSTCPFERIRHHANNDTVEERTSANRISAIIWQSLQEQAVEDSLGLDVLGIGTPADRNAAGAVRSSYILPYDLGFLRAGVIPLHAFKNTVHEIELFIAQAKSFVESDATNPITVTISNLEWHVETVTSWDGSYERSLFNMVDRSEFTIWFQDWTTFQNLVQAKVQDLLISARAMSVNSIISAYFKTDTLYDPTVNDKFTRYEKYGTTSFQFRINGKYIPEEAIDCSAGNGIEAYMYYCRWAGAWFANAFGGRPTKVNLDDFNTNSFLMVGDFRNNAAQVLNNFSTDMSTGEMVFKLQLDGVGGPPGVIPPGLAVMHYVSYNTVCQVLPSGKVLIRS